MAIYFVSTSFPGHDLHVYQYGEQACTPSYSFGPCVRNSYFLHYVYEGCGRFEVHDKRFDVKKGQMFLICPQEVTYYEADSLNPWLYRWVEFSGELVSSFLHRSALSQDNPIFTDKTGAVGDALWELLRHGNQPYEDVMGRFWLFLSALMATKKDESSDVLQEQYVKKAVLYIQTMLHQRILVSDLADYVNINRSYLSRLFRQYTGVSPQQYILACKLSAATQFLCNPQFSVSQVARSVGYDDPLDFSKAFKARYGVSPTLWRRSPHLSDERRTQLAR
ncbi:MAG: AraC family transcriptional regulator [Clostridia bacterium]|nr:AraC family transcriptional regulator [Clostridia bacterium]